MIECTGFACSYRSMGRAICVCVHALSPSPWGFQRMIYLTLWDACALLGGVPSSTMSPIPNPFPTPYAFSPWRAHWHRHNHLLLCQFGDAAADMMESMGTSGHLVSSCTSPGCARSADMCSLCLPHLAIWKWSCLGMH